MYKCRIKSLRTFKTSFNKFILSLCTSVTKHCHPCGLKEKKKKNSIVLKWRHWPNWTVSRSGSTQTVMFTGDLALFHCQLCLQASSLHGDLKASHSSCGHIVCLFVFYIKSDRNHSVLPPNNKRTEFTLIWSSLATYVRKEHLFSWFPSFFSWFLQK